jgi:hypothetical protein
MIVCLAARLGILQTDIVPKWEKRKIGRSTVAVNERRCELRAGTVLEQGLVCVKSRHKNEVKVHA